VYWRPFVLAVSPIASAIRQVRSAMNRTALALQAAKAALRLRQELQIPSTAPLAVYDVAKRLAIDVWFVDITTLEGTYLPGPPATILVTSHRPAGRQTMTCAHEIGHHVFGHGSHIDEMMAGDKVQSTTVEEFLANTFAVNFLMTRGVVAQGFLSRGISATSPRPDQVYAVANWLGVGYTTLLYHMRSALKTMPRLWADRLLKIAPRDIRVEIAETHGLGDVTGDIIVVDENWHGRPIDGQVGDVLLLPDGSKFQDKCGQVEGRGLSLTCPGLGRVENADLGWAQFVRVSRRGYCGLADYRHLEEVEDD